MADQICYAILCVFSYVAAGQNKAYLPDPISTSSTTTTITTATATPTTTTATVATSPVASTAAVGPATPDLILSKLE